MTASLGRYALWQGAQLWADEASIVRVLRMARPEVCCDLCLSCCGGLRQVAEHGFALAVQSG